MADTKINSKLQERTAVVHDAARGTLAIYKTVHHHGRTSRSRGARTGMQSSQGRASSHGGVSG